MHIKKNIHLIYKQEYCKDKQREIVELFVYELVPIMDDPDYPALIEEWKQNLDDDAYEKI